MARPTELTPELQKEVLQLARSGVPKRVIADAVGIARSTLNYWLRLGSDDFKPEKHKKPPADLEPYRKLSDAFTRARANVIVICEATWLKAIKEGDAAQAAHWLKVHEPNLYRDQSDINIQFGDRQQAMDAWKQSIIDMTPGADTAENEQSEA